MGFFRQRYWSELHALVQGIFLTKLARLLSPKLAGGFFITSVTWEAPGEQYQTLKSGCWVCLLLLGCFFFFPLSQLTEQKIGFHQLCTHTYINTYICASSVIQSCLTLCGPTDRSPLGSSLHGIFQAKILEWVSKPSSRGSSKPWDQTPVSCVSCTGRWILYYTTWEALPLLTLLIADTKLLPLVSNSPFIPLLCEFGAVMFPAHEGTRSCRSSSQLPPAVPLWSPLHPYSNASCLQQLQLLWEVQVSDLQAPHLGLEEKSLLTHLRGLSLRIPSSIAIPSYLSCSLINLEVMLYMSSR